MKALPNADVRGGAGELDPFKVQANFEALGQIIPDKVPLVTALPASPVDGQVVHYRPTGWASNDNDGVVWTCRYSIGAATAQKWQVLGGNPAVVQDTTVRTTVCATNIFSTPASHLIAGAPTLTVPATGVYDVTISGSMTQTTQTIAQINWVGLWINGTTTSVANVEQMALPQVFFGAYYMHTQLNKTIRVALTAGNVLEFRLQVWHSNTTLTVQNLFGRIMPVRLT
jgi:hypothetical protein